MFRSLTVRENLIMQSGKGEEAEAISQACEVFRHSAVGSATSPGR